VSHRVLGAVDETSDHRRGKLRATNGTEVAECADVDTLELGDGGVDANA
jgi:hypothetical protein